MSSFFIWYDRFTFLDCRLSFHGFASLGSWFLNSTGCLHCCPHGQAYYAQQFSWSLSQLLCKSSFTHLNHSVLHPQIYLYKIQWSSSFFRITKWIFTIYYFMLIKFLCMYYNASLHLFLHWAHMNSILVTRNTGNRIHLFFF